MIEIGGRPILWHIMKTYAAHGVNDFIICLGYKGYIIKEYFANYFLHMSDVTFDMAENRMEVHHRHAEPWRVTLVDTGESTLTGGRLKRVREYLSADEPFCFTYGDGVADLDMAAQFAFHAAHGKLATVTAVLPPGRYGALVRDGDGRGKGSGALSKSRVAMAAGSMAGSSCCRRRCWSVSMAMPRPGSRHPWRAWRAMAS